jgi:hypothetical protein
VLVQNAEQRQRLVADGVYELTRLGTHLVKAMQPLLKWSGDWAKALQD